VNWLARWRRPKPVLDEHVAKRVAQWRSAVLTRPWSPVVVTEWVVLDTETTGLDVRSDALLSIGAVRMAGPQVEIGRSFYREIRPDRTSEVANILIHGIGRAAQLSGDPQPDVLASFLAFAGGRPLVAFNAQFDRAMLETAVERHLGMRWRATWVDAADLAIAMFPADATVHKTLDDWLARFEIAHHERHNALADALCTAQLFQVLLAKAAREGYSTLADLGRAQRYHHWQRKR
jgi:DNA polymerase III epsilon subunit family exonuclease